MKLLFFTDPQIWPYNAFSRSRGSFTFLLKEALDSLLWVADEVKKEKPDFVFCGGDVVEVSEEVGVHEINVVSKGFKAIGDACEEVGAGFRTILGNHDIHQDTGETIVHIIPYLDGVIERMRIETIKGRSEGSVRILYVPYTKDFDAVKKFVEENQKDYEIALTHLDVTGVRYITGMATKNAMDPGVFMKPTFNGHYHHPSQQGYVTMIGALRHMNFNDKVAKEEGPRGLLIYDTGSNTFDRKENPNSSHYYTIEVENEDEIEESLSVISDPLRSFVRITCPHDAVGLVNDALSELGIKGKVVIPLTKTRTDPEEIRQTISTFDHSAIVNKFIDDNCPEDLDIRWIKKSSQDLLKTVAGRG